MSEGVFNETYGVERMNRVCLAYFKINEPGNGFKNPEFWEGKIVDFSIILETLKFREKNNHMMAPEHVLKYFDLFSDEFILGYLFGNLLKGWQMNSTEHKLYSTSGLWKDFNDQD